MKTELDLEASVQRLLARFSATQRRKALREVASYLLRSNRKRIRMNTQPDGSAMTQRKKGTQRMFRKLGQQMQSRSDAQQVEVGFYGRIGKIATNHQLGRQLKRNNHTIDLPIRELLGLSDADKLAIYAIFTRHIQAVL